MVVARLVGSECERQESAPVYLSHFQSHLRGIGVRV